MASARWACASFASCSMLFSTTGWWTFGSLVMSRILTGSKPACGALAVARPTSLHRDLRQGGPGPGSAPTVLQREGVHGGGFGGRRGTVVGDVLAVPAAAQDRAQRHVHCVGTDDALGREWQVDRDDWAGPVLPAAEASVAAHQPLERRDFLGSRVYQAVDVDVGRLRAVGDALDEPRGVRPEGHQRVRTLDPPVVEAVRAVVPQGDRSLRICHHDEPDAGVPRQALHEAGEPAIERGSVQALLLAPDVDEPEVARPEDMEGLLARRRPVRGPLRDGA